MDTAKSLKSLLKKPSEIKKIKDTNDKNKTVKINKNKITIDSQNENDSTESENADNYLDINVNELLYPCKNKRLFARIALEPYQMVDEIYLNLKKNLIEKQEGKCTKDGYVIKVHKILNPQGGEIHPENFTGCAIYDVEYLANICTIAPECTIIAKVSSFVKNSGFAIADFGDIIKIVFTINKKDINTKNFTIQNDKNIVHILTQQKIELGIFVKIQIKTFKFYPGDVLIKCIGYLEDIATQEDIENFAFKDEFVKQQTENDRLSNVYFNEENEIEDKLEENSNLNKSNTIEI